MDNGKTLTEVYENVIKFAKSHYENFPVVSVLIPKNLRKDVAVIYWFARTADDIADEGNLTAENRIAKLNEFKNRLTELLKGNYENYYEQALYNTIVKKKLSHENFYNLLKAFRQDISKKRYETYDELLDYCKNSAAPVGRLILELFNIRNDEANIFSDKICTALQLTNFYQDTFMDFAKGRIYFPKDEMQTFGIDEKTFKIKENNPNFKKMLEFNIKRTRQLFNDGKNLLPFLSGRLKFEIKWTILGGERILDKIVKSGFNVLNYRPKLSKIDYGLLLLKAIINK
jgi:squalene synthase HpnC